MSTDGSVTRWLHQLGAGDAAAAQPLWERYFNQLVRRARRHLRGAPRRAADEEDVALSAFNSFCQGATKGRFPRLQDRDDLWGLLVVITARKAINLARYERQQQRDSRRVVSNALPPSSADSSTAQSLIEQVIGREPTPEFAAQMAEEYRRLLDLLDDGELRQMAIWKMEGYTNPDIAAKLDSSPPTVGRRLRRIRKLWEEEAAR